MFTIVTLELFKIKSVSEDRSKENSKDNINSGERYGEDYELNKTAKWDIETVENFIICLPLIITLLAIIIMSIIHNIFM